MATEVERQLADSMESRLRAAGIPFERSIDADGGIVFEERGGPVRITTTIGGAVTPDMQRTLAIFDDLERRAHEFFRAVGGPGLNSTPPPAA